MADKVIGRSVTCKHAVEAYYSNYGPDKGTVIEFKPGMVGIVSSVAPKVCLLKKGVVDPRYDRKADFLVVDYIDPTHGKRRVGLNYCNAVFLGEI